jgi:hypothetical protein
MLALIELFEGDTAVVSRRERGKLASNSTLLSLSHLKETRSRRFLPEKSPLAREKLTHRIG